MNARFRILLACIGVVLCALAGSALTMASKDSEVRDIDFTVASTSGTEHLPQRRRNHSARSGSST